MDPKSNVASADGLSWLLVYTKARAEAWTDINLRNQGFVTLAPRVAARRGFGMLFPRYVFVGCGEGARSASIRSTLGVQYVVQCGEKAARVPPQVVEEIRSRMDAHGVVHLDIAPADPLFAKRERERVRALVKLAQAGFRVKSA